MSYQKLNQVTRQFTFPIPQCDDAVQYIYIEAKYFISVYMNSGYWQVVVEEESCERLALFTLGGKQWWKVMTMGNLNVAPKFVAMMMNLQME